MKKNKVLISIIVLIIFVLSIITIRIYSINNKVVVANTNSNEQIRDNNMLSIMLETDTTGTYERSNSTSWPTTGYVFNETLSGCENGGTLSWDSNNNTVVFTGNTSDKCFVYFDKLTLSRLCAGQSLSSCIMTQVYTGTDGDSNIYKHDGAGTYTNASEEACWSDSGTTRCENSYRYAGSSATTNNYVCFGYSDASVCKASNFLDSDYAYRIIGVFNENDGSAGTTSYQVKLIKNNWLTTNYIGTGQNSATDTWYWQGMNKTDHNTAYGTDYNNTWSHSTLNTDALNTRYVGTIGSTWTSLIEDHIWKVGGNTRAKIGTQTVKTAYTNEIINNVTTNSTDSLLVSTPTKIGLMYVSDYMYGASPDYWQKYGYNSDSTLDYRSATSSNWMYKGEGKMEWTVSRWAGSRSDAFCVYSSGNVGYGSVYYAYGVRPSFYLKHSTKIIIGDGSSTNPYIVG